MQNIKNYLLAILFFTITFSHNSLVYAEKDIGRCYDIHDPNEKFNRIILKSNIVIFRTLVYPPMVAYNIITPSWVKNRINNVFDHLTLPKTLINTIAQKKRTATSDVIGKFLTNTILGLGGLFDVASKFGISVEPQGFQDTLAYYNMPYGAYSITPLLGPSTTRGTIGQIVDFVTDPTHWVLYGIFNQFYVVPAYDILVGINKVSRYNEVIKEYIQTSVDPYSTIRGTYIQHLSSSNPKCDNVQAVDYTLYE